MIDRSGSGSDLVVVAKVMWSLPWSNIPTLLVPFYLIIHGVIFAHLARANRMAVV
jgi:hypothetical protein